MLICADICGPWKPIWTRFLKVQLPVGPQTFWDRRWRAFDECSSPSASHSSHTYGKAKKNRKNSKIFGKFGTSPVELYVTSDGYKHIRRRVWVHTCILDHIYVHTVTFPGCRRPYHVIGGSTAALSCIWRVTFFRWKSFSFGTLIDIDNPTSGPLSIFT